MSYIILKVLTYTFQPYKPFKWKLNDLRLSGRQSRPESHPDRCFTLEFDTIYFTQLGMLLHICKALGI